MKQTAVEILETNLLGIVSFDSEVLRNKYKESFKIAKEMEKEQIIKAYKDGRSDLASNFHKSLNMSLEQYYNETYKNETK